MSTVLDDDKDGADIPVAGLGRAADASARARLGSRCFPALHVITARETILSGNTGNGAHGGRELLVVDERL